MPKKTKYGWKPSKPDQRDEEHAYAVTHMQAIPLPAATDLRPKMPPIYDQGQLGSCVGNGTGAAWQFVLMLASVVGMLPARLLIYYWGRFIEGTVNEDSGLEIRDGFKALAKYGCCDEKLWPYNIKKFKVKPVAKALKAALAHLATTYHAVANAGSTGLTEIKTCLAQGFPVVGGFTVYDSFESAHAAQTGIIPMPGKKESVLGGHCVVIVGYDDVKQWFIVRNSWGTGWGDKGYCYMPYAYWTNKNLASDCWTLRTVANGKSVKEQNDAKPLAVA